MKIKTRAGSVVFENVTKTYGLGAVTAIDNVSFTINPGELVTLLGPSGCGKTTTLRMIAGLEHATKGKILIGGKDVTQLPATDRDVSMVFQSYALFPHMTVLENVAYGLTVTGVAKAEAHEKAEEGLDLVGLAGYGRRLPSELSGGQQQRVAVARALVLEPEVLLLDEPLSALDYKLRRTMQVELKRLQRELGITFVFVTHDQEEALSMSDRVVVLKDGAIQQLGTPREIYERPANLFTARFVGETNLFPGYLTSVEDTGITLDILGLSRTLQKPGFTLRKGEQVNVLLRPEDIRVLAPEDEKGLAGRIVERNYKGSTLDSVIHLEDGTEVLASEFFDEDDPAFDYKLGEPVRVSWVDGWEWLLPVELEPVNNDAEEGLSTNA